MIRVSTTTLESFRRVVQTEWGDQEELIASIKREPFEQTWQMLAGAAWQNELAGLPNVGPYSFDPKHVEAARKQIGPGVSEVKGIRTFDVMGRDVTVVAQVDHAWGTFLQENKAKFSTADARDYEASLQWRFYLAVHGAAYLQYNLWSFAPPKGGHCELKDVTWFRFWPYMGLEGDCRKWLGEFVDWAEDRQLLPFLNREGSSRAA